jgi:hypothetical protein
VRAAGHPRAARGRMDHAAAPSTVLETAIS